MKECFGKGGLAANQAEACRRDRAEAWLRRDEEARMDWEGPVHPSFTETPRQPKRLPEGAKPTGK